MFESSSDDWLLPTHRHEEMVNKLLDSEESDGDQGGSPSLTKSLLHLAELGPCVFPSARYKTELCNKYASALCTYGERCHFAHGLSELRLPSHHPKYKTELCRNYHTTGYCDYGNRCLFVHNPTEQRPVQTQAREPKPRRALCHTFSAFGFCLHGNRCRFWHAVPSRNQRRASPHWTSPGS